MFWILALLGVVGFGINHNLYIGVIDVYPSTSQPIVITVFTDDLENALFNEFHNHTLSDSAVNKYFQAHCQITINNKPVASRVTKMEQLTDNTCKLFVNLSAPATWHNWSLNADFFMELYATQNNIVHIHTQPPTYFRLTKQKSSCSVVF